MGLFKFLKKKNDIPESPIPRVEPLPLQFEIADFSMNKITIEPEQTLKPEIVAAITVAIQLIINTENITDNKQPLLRRHINKSWKIAGIQRLMQVRQ
ncbi:MAG: hypothetical protein WCP79_11015 [Bacillota bacterium]